MSQRIANFSAGPAMLPEEVLETVKDNLFSYKGSGIGIMEMSHRSKAFTEIIETAEKNLRELLSIRDTHSVIFVPGGATTQFSAVPLNLVKSGQVANYAVTGYWAKKAWEEAERFSEAHIASSSEDKKYSYIPKSLNLSKNAAYLHFTSNNTIAGTQFKSEPEVGDVTLVCDASSDLLHKKLDISKYGLIYAGAQKNMGPAGVTIVIIRNDLLTEPQKPLPIMLDYRTHVDAKSVYNTPPTFPIYVVGEVFKWIIKQGGLDEIEKRNRHKAGLIYEVIDASKFYSGHAALEDRSVMNLTFKLPSVELEEKFLVEAKSRGLVELKGHRSVGGLRASIYNYFPVSGVEALASFMREFEQQNS